MEATWKNLVRQARTPQQNDDVLFDRAVSALKAARAMKRRKLTPPSFGSSELNLICSLAATQERSMIRRVCAAVVATVLSGDAAAQGRALVGGGVWRLDDWLVVAPGEIKLPPSDEIAGENSLEDKRLLIEESVRQLLTRSSSLSKAEDPTTMRQVLPEGVRDRKILMEIRNLPDPAKAPIAVKLCPNLRQMQLAQTQPSSPKQAKNKVDERASKPREIEIWRGDTTLKTTTGRSVDAVCNVTKVMVGDVVGDDTDDLRTNPSYLCCHRVGEFSAAMRKDALRHSLEVVRVRIASQGSDFEAYLSRPVLDGETTLANDEFVGNGAVISDLCQSLIKLPWFSSDDPAVPVWRVPETLGMSQKVAVRCIQLLVSAAGRSANTKRAVLLAVVSEINKALLLRATIKAKPGETMRRKSAIFSGSMHRKYVECRDAIVETLKGLTLVCLGVHEACENGAFGFTRSRRDNAKSSVRLDPISSLEQSRLGTIDALSRIASNREDPPPNEPETDVFYGHHVILGRTQAEDHIVEDSETKCVSPLKRSVAGVLFRAEALASHDRKLRERKLAARQNSAALMKLRHRIMNQIHEYRRHALERCIDFEAGHVEARRSKLTNSSVTRRQ